MKKKLMIEVGFEPTPINGSEPKSDALDHSATLPIYAASILYSSTDEERRQLRALQNTFLNRMRNSRIRFIFYSVQKLL